MGLNKGRILLILPGGLFIILAVFVPLVYLDTRGIQVFQEMEGILLGLTFVGCMTAGITLLLFVRPHGNGKTEPHPSEISNGVRPGWSTQSANYNDHPDVTSGITPLPRAGPVRKIKHHLKPPSEVDIMVNSAFGPDKNNRPIKPKFTTLIDELKNYIKLEAWRQALQKANELIHYYPQTAEAGKVRDNLAFLSHKAKEATC